MACSDNVVRAGLTPKLKDVDTLCSMLTYHDGPPSISKGTQIDQSTTVYTPPISEFQLERTQLSSPNDYMMRSVYGGKNKEA